MPFTRTKIPDFELANPLYAGSRVSFFTVDEAGNPTPTLAVLFLNTAGPDTAANPQRLDSEGKFQRPVYADVPVIGRVAGIHVSDHDTGVILPAVDGSPLEEAHFAAFIAESAAGAARAAELAARRSAAIAAQSQPNSDQFILAQRIFNGDW